MLWVVAGVAFCLFGWVLTVYCLRGRKFGKDVAVAVLLRMPKGHQHRAAEYKSRSIVPAILNAGKGAEVHYSGLVEMTYAGSEVWDAIAIAYFPDKDVAEAGLAAITRAERAYNQSLGLSQENSSGGGRHAMLATSGAMAAMQHMSYPPSQPAVPPPDAAESTGVTAKKRRILTTDSLASYQPVERKTKEEEEAEEAELPADFGRTDSLHTLLLPMQPQPPLATFIYTWILDWLVGGFNRKAKAVEEQARRKYAGGEEGEEEEDCGYNPVVPEAGKEFMLPNARQRRMLKERSRVNDSPIVMVNLVELLNDEAEYDYMMYAMKVSVLCLPSVGGKVVYQGPCMAGQWNSISLIQYDTGEKGVIMLEDMDVYHDCHEHRERSLRSTVMLVTRPDGSDGRDAALFV